MHSLKVLILTALLIFLLSKLLFSVSKASIARMCMRPMSFSVYSRLPSNLHFFQFLITRLRFARVDGVVSFIYAYDVLCLAVGAQLMSVAYFISISK